MVWDYIDLRVYGTGTDGKALYFEGDITSISIIPEPATIGLFSLGGIGLIRRKRNRQQN